jgi:BirA family biotin operon repressor/biotin-[acetyl-CoA-carboxylase] ligase
VDETPSGREPLSQDALRAEVIRPGGLWTGLTVLPDTGSTNADLAAAAQSGAPEGTVLLAERQHAGRGRLGRTWTSPPAAGLILSLLLRPGDGEAFGEPAGATGGPAAPGGPTGVPGGPVGDGSSVVPPTRYGWLPLLVGVAVTAAVRRVAGVEAALKWPNDVLVGPAGSTDRAKCAGILAELVPAGEGAPALVVGLGLNVTLGADELPRADATSLALAGATGDGLDRRRLLVATLGEVAGWYRRFRAAGGDPEVSGLRAAYLGMCDTVGRPVRVELPDGKPLSGTASNVDRDGRLVVTRRGAAPVAVAAGDVVHVRPDRAG